MTASTQLDGRLDSTTPLGAPQSTFPNVLCTGFFFESSADSITARAGGGQALGTLLTAQQNRVPTVVTAADSVKLVVSQKGIQQMVTNASANSLNVFPNDGGTGTEAINALGANAAFALGAGKTVTFVCYTAGIWHTIPLVP